jgi:ABC-type multidrug transport system fused ATPase/permease subunit
MQGAERDEVSMPKIMGKLLLGYAHAHPWITFLSVVSLLVIPVQDVLLPHLTGRMVNAIKSKSRVLTPFVTVVVAIAVMQVCLVGVDLIDAMTMPSVQNYFRDQMLRCVMDMHDTSHTSDVHAGDLLSKFIKVPFTMSFWFESIKSLTPYVLVYIGATCYFAWIDPLLAVAMTVAVCVLLATVVFNLRRCSDVSTERDVVLNTINETIDDTLRNMPAVYASMRKERMLDDVKSQEENFRRLYIATTTCSIKTKLVIVPTLVTLIGFCLWRCRALVISDKMSTGTFVSVFLVIIYLMSSMMRVTMYGKAMVHNWGVVNSSSDLFRQCSNPVQTAGSSTDTRGAIEQRARTTNMTTSATDMTTNMTTSATDMTKRTKSVVDMGGAFGMSHVWYGDGVLRDFSFQVEEGERVALVGPVGCGKSTTLRLIMRLSEPDAGVVYVKGRAYADLTVSEVRAQFGYVPQSPVLFDLTVLDNIRFGNEDATERDVWEAAERIGAVDKLRSIGLHTPVGKSGTRLSGGQRQLVWMLRVMLARPYVVVLDEPTSALDDDSKALVLALIDTIGTALVVTHDADFAASFATRTIVMEARTRPTLL